MIVDLTADSEERYDEVAKRNRDVTDRYMTDVSVNTAGIGKQSKEKRNNPYKASIPKIVLKSSPVSLFQPIKRG
jgi:hypothetical protein